MEATLTRLLRRGLIAGAIAAALAVAGCGGGSASSSPATHAPASHAPASSAAGPHNIVIPGLEVTSATVTGDPGGAQVSFTVTFAHAGRYSFHCQYHASAGMTGVFVNCPVGLGATLVLSGGSGREPGCPGH